jgi:hypothetical protein
VPALKRDHTSQTNDIRKGKQGLTENNQPGSALLHRCEQLPETPVGGDDNLPCVQ